MPAKGRYCLAAILAFGLAAIVPRAGAAEELTKISLIQTHPVISVGEEVFLYAVPKRLGWLRDAGIEESIQGAANATAAGQALQSGAFQFATTLPEVILQIQEQGGDVVAFYNLRRDNGIQIAVKPESSIRTLQDLKGKTIGALGWGAAATVALSYSLEQIGIKPGDYGRVNSGIGAAAAAALTSGQIDALGLWDSMYAAMENNGVKLRYVDLPIERQIGGFTVATTTRYINANPKAVEGFCRAINKGLYFSRVNPAAAIRIFLQEFPTLVPPNSDLDKVVQDDVRILQRWLDNSEIGVPLDARTGDIVPATWKFSQDLFKGAGMLKGTTPVEQGYTMRFFEACNDFDRVALKTMAESYR